MEPALTLSEIRVHIFDSDFHRGFARDAERRPVAGEREDSTYSDFLVLTRPTRIVACDSRDESGDSHHSYGLSEAHQTTR